MWLQGVQIAAWQQLYSPCKSQNPNFRGVKKLLDLFVFGSLGRQIRSNWRPKKCGFWFWKGSSIWTLFYLTAKDTFVSQTPCTSDRAISSHDSYRHSNPISVLLAPSHSCCSPWIRKLWGLESYGQRLIYWNGKTKIIAVFFPFWQFFFSYSKL